MKLYKCVYPGPADPERRDGRDQCIDCNAYFVRGDELLGERPTINHPTKGNHEFDAFYCRNCYAFPPFRKFRYEEEK